jgi:hypothetical protein
VEANRGVNNRGKFNLIGSIGTAFIMAFQIVSARSEALLVLRSFARWKVHDCRASFPNFRGASIVGLFANIWKFYPTRKVVYNVRRVLPLRQKANKARTVLADDDIHVFEE